MPDYQDVKISDFPNAESVDASDKVTGLKNGNNTNFSFNSILAWLISQFYAVFLPASSKGAAGGVASLDANGTLPSDQLPEIAPSDIGAQDTITASGILKGDGQGGVSAAVSGTDYQAPLTAGTDYATPAMIPTVPSAYTSNPEMDGTASPGSSTAWAKGDHVHPSDSTKANQSQLAYVETGTTASRAYAVGEYFCWNGLLYRVKTAISSGGTFTVNTNCEQVTVGGFNAVRRRFDLLWTNINTSTAFAGQTIPLDLSDYDAVLIEQLPERSLVSAQVSYLCRKSTITNNIQSMYLPARSTVPTFYQRTVTVNTNGVTFGDGFEKPATATARTTNNHVIHPRAIYGIKF